MTGKQYAGGMIGGFIGVFIDVGIGFIGDFPWFALVGMIIGLIVASGEFGTSASTSSLMSKEEKEKQNLENFIGKYKAIYRKLPKESVDNLGGIASYTINMLGLSPQDTPQELLKMGGALATIQNEGTYGTITAEQRTKVNKLINDFGQDLNTLVPILNKTMNTAAEKGLDFGIIGGAADVALYSVMDTMEKRKNFRTANRATNEMIDRKVRELTTAIQNALL